MARRFWVIICVLVIGAAALQTPSEAQTPFISVGYWVEYDPGSLATVRAQGAYINWIITTQFALAGPGGGITGTHDARVLRTARQRGAAVHFQVANYGDSPRQDVHSMLTDSDASARTITAILGVMDQYRYDGVSLDFENIPAADRDVLTTFVVRLAAAVHRRGKVITVAVAAKTVEDVTNEWNGAFDYAALGRAADGLIVLAYDEHWSHGEPGPVASAPWVDVVAQFTVAEIAPSKAILAVPFYGYAWPEKGAADAVSMGVAIERANRAGVAIQWDPVAQVPFYRLPGATVYFENPRSIGVKLALAKAWGFGGVAFWRLGLEAAGLWEAVVPYLRANPVVSGRQAE